jgi:hypothetical protein
MSIATTKPHLRRLDDTTWSYTPAHGDRIPADEFEEIRFSVPVLGSGRETYELVSAVRAAFEAHRPRLKRDLFRNGFRIKINDPDSPVTGTWDVDLHRMACLSRRTLTNSIRTIKQFFPFTRTLSKRKTAVIDVHRTKDCFASRMASVTKRITSLEILRWDPPEALTLRLPAIVSPREAILQESFHDPFTQLASKALKTISPFFIMEAEHNGGYRFVLDNSNQLLLEPSNTTDDDVVQQVMAENRKVVRTYRDFLVREYGRDFVDHIEFSYNIHFDEMIEKGLPLYPDHVSKCNIGANNIEMRHIEDLWLTLQRLADTINQPKNRRHLQEEAAGFLLHVGQELSLPLRVLRNILRQIPHEDGTNPTVADLQAFITALVGQRPPQSVRSLPPSSFNRVVEMIMPSDAERQKAFTGRKIRHLCVMGFNTMGEPNTPCRCRDLFELLHIFGDMRKEERWKNFYELLSHVVVKKSIYREAAQPDSTGQTVHVGLLIPGPDAKGGVRRWFYNEAFFDDSKGNVNYVLLPACVEFRSADNRQLPMIKLYRSTASNKNAENWADSLIADLNPNGAPGSLNPELSLPHEQGHFFERTIPVWMGHLLLALKARRWAEREEELDSIQQNALDTMRSDHLQKTVETFKIYMTKFHPEDAEEAIGAITHFYDLKLFDDLEQTLISYGHKYREDPRYKTSQDVACVGHSLGGALAQEGTFYFSAYYGRMPLPGNQFICYSSDGPAMKNEQDSQFMEFGHYNREMFKQLKVKWRVYHQFEAGDFVPQAGGSHLGTTEFNTYHDVDWLDEVARVFRPLEGADALSIVNPPTHGRRIGTAVDEKDYACTSVSAKDLADYDHPSRLWGLNSRLRKIWGYRLLNNPRLTEKVRSIAGRVLQTLGILRILDNLQGSGVGLRDRNGVLAVRYTPLSEALRS